MNRIILAVSLVFAGALTISCGSHTWEDFFNNLKAQFNAITENNLLQNSRLGFARSEESIPDGSVNAINEVIINGSALPGGSTSIRVTSSVKLKELYLQLEGENGFYKWDLEPDDEVDQNPYVYFVVLEFNQILEGDSEYRFIVGGLTADGEIVKTKNVKLKTHKAGAGKLQISLSWDVDDDVDLHVFSPSGEHLYYGHPEAKNGNLDVDSNAECLIDGIKSENIFFDVLEDGEYKVEVHLFEKCSSSRDGAKYYVTANLQGKFVTFSKLQSGQFNRTDYEDVVKEIGTIKIKNEACTNCNN